jgi:hypothetical protein
MNILEFFYVLDKMVLLVCFVTASARFAQLWRAQTAQAARCKISKLALPSFVLYIPWSHLVKIKCDSCQIKIKFYHHLIEILV